MSSILSVTVPRSPEAIPTVAAAVAATGTNLRGLAATTSGETTTVHILLAGPTGAVAASMDKAGVSVSGVRGAIILDPIDRPGQLAKISGLLRDAGVTIEIAFTTGPWLVLAVDGEDTARGAIRRAFVDDDCTDPGVIRSYEPDITAPIGE